MSLLSKTIKSNNEITSNSSYEDDLLLLKSREKKGFFVWESEKKISIEKIMYGNKFPKNPFVGE